MIAGISNGCIKVCWCTATIVGNGEISGGIACWWTRSFTYCLDGGDGHGGEECGGKKNVYCFVGIHDDCMLCTLSIMRNDSKR